MGDEEVGVNGGRGDQRRIGQLLGLSILSPDFVLTPEWTHGLTLTIDGQRTVDELCRSNPDISVWAATFACFLHDSWPLIELPFDRDSLMGVISDQMANKKLYFPNHLGRDLHDALGERFPEAMHVLDNSSTCEVLGRIPQGVMQIEDICVGPLGVHSLETRRRLTTRRFVVVGEDELRHPLPLMLETNQTSDINVALREMDQGIQRLGISSLSADPPFHKVRFVRDPGAGLAGALVDFMVDGLYRDELAVVVQHAYAAAAPHQRDGMRRALGLESGEFQAALKDQPQAAMIQLLLHLEDQQIREAIDGALAESGIDLAVNEVRRSRVKTRWEQRTTHEAELSRLGLRLRQRSESPAMSMMKAVHHLYFSGHVAGPEDLAFILDKPDTSDADDLMNAAVRIGDTRAVVEDVLLADRRSADAITEHLGIVRGHDLARSELIERVAWQLGEPIRLSFDGLSRALSFGQAVTDAVNSQASEEEVLGQVAKLFKELERCLRQALIFSTWALSVDHERSRDGFVYDPEMGSEVLDFIERNTSTQDSFRLQTAGRNSFAPLAAGFSRLAHALQSTRGTIDTDAEDAEDAEVRPRVFPGGPAFASVTESSQVRMLGTLREMSELLGDSLVSRVRNATIHDDNPFPRATEFREAIDRIASWIGLAQTSGLYPMTSTLVSRQHDGMWREELRYANSSTEQRLFIPQWHDSGRMPSEGDQLVFVSCASLGPVGPLRFKVTSKSNDDMWRDYPRRMTAGSDNVAKSEE